MFVLHQMEMSPFTEKVRRILNFKGVPYREVVHQPSQLNARRRLHRAAKLPIVQYQGQTIGDSTQIALFVEEKFPDPPLIPLDPGARGLCMMLEDWADESLYFHEMRLRFSMPHNAHRFIPRLVAGETRSLQKLAPALVRKITDVTLYFQGMGRRDLDTFINDVIRHMEAIAGRLNDQEYLVGSQVTLADIAVWVQLACIIETPEGMEIAADFPQISEWMTRVDAATAGP